MNELNALIVDQIYVYLIVLARIGGALFIMPGFGDASVSRNIRVYIALSMTLVLFPILSQFIPPAPANPFDLAILIITELIVGIFLGVMARTIMSALSMCSYIVAHSTQLINAFVFNPQISAQSTVIGSLFALIGLLFLFISNLHHMLLLGVVNSYGLFVPGVPIIQGDFVHILSETLNKSMQIGLYLAAPFIIVSLMVYFTLGLIARLTPQIQVFFLAMPIKILVGFTTLMGVLAIMFRLFFEEFHLIMSQFLN